MINLLKNLPIELQFIIFSYIKIDDFSLETKKKYFLMGHTNKWINYLDKKGIFDIDYVYFYIEPLIFYTDGANGELKLQISIYSWFGTCPPNKYINCKYNPILHIHYDRPYSIFLEKSFGNICKKINENISYLNLGGYDIDKNKMDFAGTYGPINKGIESENNIEFIKLSSLSWNKSVDPYKYFREKKINNIKHLENIIFDNIKKSLKEYGIQTKNIISEPQIIINKLHKSKKMFFKLYKPIPSQKKILNLQFKKKKFN